MSQRYAIAIHGGAGDESNPKSSDERMQYEEGLRIALLAGQRVLEKGGSSLDAVEEAICQLEDTPLFNAGRAAAYLQDGTHRLDASIMSGKDLGCGAAANLKTVRNPIALARKVFQSSPFVVLLGDDAEAFAAEQGLEKVEHNYFDESLRYAQWLEKKAGQGQQTHDTVGAVALDRHGDLAAGGSTGGLTDARVGRMSDTAIIGAGVYANNATCAIALSGTGEQIIRYTVAHEIHALIKYGGMSLQDAAEELIKKRLQKGDGGLVAVDKEGQLVVVYNTGRMFWGTADDSGRFEVGI